MSTITTDYSNFHLKDYNKSNLEGNRAFSEIGCVRGTIIHTKKPFSTFRGHSSSERIGVRGYYTTTIKAASSLGVGSYLLGHAPAPTKDFKTRAALKECGDDKMVEENKNLEEKVTPYAGYSKLENENAKDSFSNLQLAVKSLEATIITGIGAGGVGTLLFDYKIGIASGIISAALNIYGVFYRNKHYKEYYS